MASLNPDRLSNRLITDNSGVMKGASDTLPFGDEGGRSGESEKHRFTSYERDRESGTDYAINRRDSQVTGRFNRPDPFGGSAGSPQSFNRYSYVGNDPTNSTDPAGLFDPAFAAQFSKLAENFGYRIGDLPGFGTEWGSFLELELWRHAVIIRTGFDPALPKNSDDFDPNDLAGPTGEGPQTIKLPECLVKYFDSLLPQETLRKIGVHPNGFPRFAGTLVQIRVMTP